MVASNARTAITFVPAKYLRIFNAAAISGDDKVWMRPNILDNEHLFHEGCCTANSDRGLDFATVEGTKILWREALAPSL